MVPRLDEGPAEPGANGTTDGTLETMAGTLETMDGMLETMGPRRPPPEFEALEAEADDELGADGFPLPPLGRDEAGGELDFIVVPRLDEDPAEAGGNGSADGTLETMAGTLETIGMLETIGPRRPPPVFEALEAEAGDKLGVDGFPLPPLGGDEAGEGLDFIGSEVTTEALLVWSVGGVLEGFTICEELGRVSLDITPDLAVIDVS